MEEERLEAKSFTHIALRLPVRSDEMRRNSCHFRMVFDKTYQRRQRARLTLVSLLRKSKIFPWDCAAAWLLAVATPV